MALNDLNAEARQPGFNLDDPTEHQLVDQILQLVNDANGEVKSVAVKTRVTLRDPAIDCGGMHDGLTPIAQNTGRLATLIPHVNSNRIQTIIDRLVQFAASKDEGVRDIASLGLKLVVAEVQPATPLAQTCCSKLAPELVKQLNDVSIASLSLDRRHVIPVGGRCADFVSDYLRARIRDTALVGRRTARRLTRTPVRHPDPLRIDRPRQHLAPILDPEIDHPVARARPPQRPQTRRLGSRETRPDGSVLVQQR